MHYAQDKEIMLMEVEKYKLKLHNKQV